MFSSTIASTVHLPIGLDLGVDSLDLRLRVDAGVRRSRLHRPRFSPE
jgi:hypothetical protein